MTTSKRAPPKKSAAVSQEHLNAVAAQKAALQAGLPHIYGWKWYPWAKAFFDSTNKLNLLCAANQISKSSTQIRKCIDWATNQKKWGTLWPTRRPRVFWYLYPSKDVATAEFENKWVPEFMPSGAFKDDPIFGWEEDYDKKQIAAIRFKSGVTVYFKSYAQGQDVLQTATIDAVFCDEELPEELYDEIKVRLLATEGYFHMVFTATLNQDMWRRALEGKGDQELFPDAFKVQVSMYDCMFYTDGTPSRWTEDRIARVIADCKDQIEVQRRVFGKFVAEHVTHFMKAKPLPDNWRIYAGVDLGTGGAKNHPAAIVFIAVSPDNKQGWVHVGWRGDGQTTVASDVLDKFKEMKGGRPIVCQVYDWHARDFGIIATRAGEPFVKANKERDSGEQVLNTLFRNNMLLLFDTAELRKLGSELTSLMHMTDKSRAKDDFVDALRYAAMAVPWDWSAIRVETETDGEEKAVEAARPWTEAERVADEIRQRRGEELAENRSEWGDLTDDIAEWNEAYGAG
jgi:phage terminase large subunit-like protein